jgi:hypothetical protein
MPKDNKSILPPPLSLCQPTKKTMNSRKQKILKAHTQRKEPSKSKRKIACHPVSQGKKGEKRNVQEANPPNCTVIWRRKKKAERENPKKEPIRYAS